jgi:hypothetical protein
MKIGIITHELKNNYGGLLQNFALQRVLKSMGHEVYTINRIKRTPVKIKVLSILNRIVKRILGENVKIRGWTSKKEDKIISQHTRDFVLNNINTTREIFSKKELIKIHKEYGFNAYIVGSDQVWRESAYGNDSEFLDFVSKEDSVKKIAYSASLGVDFWTFSKKRTAKYSYLAKKFNTISVREKSGIELCKNYLGVNAVLMPDPTLLLNKEDYIGLANKANINQSNGNLFAYILDKSPGKIEIVNRISAKLSLKPFEVMPNQSFLTKLPKGQRFDINRCVYPKVESWIRGFIDAKFVITDSFHGTVFSILFNKPFISIQNSKRGATRFQSLLSLFELEERLIVNDEDLDSIIFRDIDYNKINQIIDKLKKEAYNYLSHSLKK